MTARSYPDLAKSKRKDSLVPDPQEYDMSDLDRADETHTPTQTAEARLDLFARMVKVEVTGTKTSSQM